MRSGGLLVDVGPGAAKNRQSSSSVASVPSVCSTSAAATTYPCFRIRCSQHCRRIRLCARRGQGRRIRLRRVGSCQHLRIPHRILQLSWQSAHDLRPPAPNNSAVIATRELARTYSSTEQRDTEFPCRPRSLHPKHSIGMRYVPASVRSQDRSIIPWSRNPRFPLYT